MAGLIHLSGEGVTPITRRAMVVGAAGAFTHIGLGAANSAMAMARPTASPSPVSATGSDVFLACQRLGGGVVDPHVDTFLWSWMSPPATVGDAGAWSADPLFARVVNADVLGFAPTDCDLIVAARSPLAPVCVYQGGLNQTAIELRWTSLQAIRSDGDRWTFPTDPASPFAQATNGLTGAATFVDGALLTARTSDDLALALNTSGGSIEHLVRHAGIPADAVSCAAWNGDRVRAQLMVPEGDGAPAAAFLEESDAAVGAMPRAQMVCGWATPTATTLRLTLASAADAAVADAILSWRRAHMTSPTTGAIYADTWASFEPQVEGAHVVLTSTVSDARSLWHDALTSLDCWPLAWHD